MKEQGHGFHGLLEGVSLTDVLQLFCMSMSTVHLKVEGDGDEGVICVVEGQVVHAQTTRREGEDAFYEIFSWPTGSFSVRSLESPWVGKVSINKPWEQLILESARMKDEARSSRGGSTVDGGEEKVVVYCDQCAKRFYVPAEKLPADKKVRIRCPTCKGLIDVQRVEDVPDALELEVARWKREEPMMQDVFMDGRESVLICSADDQIRQKLEEHFVQEDYHVRTARGGREAFKFLREGLFQVVIIDEPSNKDSSREHHVLLSYIQKLPTHIRRRFYLCILSDHVKTRDWWAAFRMGADLVVNRRTIDLIHDLLHYTTMQHKRFYAPFLEELQILRAT